jgi:hypothetical protein
MEVPGATALATSVASGPAVGTSLGTWAPKLRRRERIVWGVRLQQGVSQLVYKGELFRRQLS